MKPTTNAIDAGLCGFVGKHIAPLDRAEVSIGHLASIGVETFAGVVPVE